MPAFVAPAALGVGTRPRHHFPAVRANRTACKISPSAVTPLLPPTSLPAAVSQAEAALAARTPRRAAVNLLTPGLNPALEDTFPYSESTLCDAAALLALAAARSYPTAPHVALLFKSAGNAASARSYYTSPGSPAPPDIASALAAGDVSIESFAGRDAARPGSDVAAPCPPRAVVVIVNPVSARGDPVVADVRSLVEAGEAAAADIAPTAHILLNPDFDADMSALGVRDRAARDALLASFDDAYYLRTLASIARPSLLATERGALLRAAPGRYGVFALDASGAYDLVKEFDERPNRNQVTDAFEKPAVARDMNTPRSPQAIADEASFLKTLLALSVVASAAFYALRRAG